MAKISGSGPNFPVNDQVFFLFLSQKSWTIRQTKQYGHQGKTRENVRNFAFSITFSRKLKAMASTAEESAPIKIKHGIITVNSQKDKGT